MTWNNFLLVIFGACVITWIIVNRKRIRASVRWWCGYPPRAPKVPPAAIARHPAGKVRGLPRDGRPLDAYERRILGCVDMDSIVDVPEPSYDKRESR